MNEAIQKAIEGGYEIKGLFMRAKGANIEDGKLVLHKEKDGWNSTEKMTIDEAFENKLLLDPLFWKSLGKSLGWKEGEYMNDTLWKGEWHERWVSFIDHLAEGGTPDDFFKSLIDNK